jgi:uncharacterized protein YutE (UPF0331/DUF86 family)
MNALLEKKLQFLLEYLQEFREFTGIRFAEYERDTMRKRAAERLIQLLVEVGSDIAGAILLEKEGIVSETYYASFIELGKKGFISVSLAKKLASSAGLRNRIIHEYGEYKDRIVFSNIKPLYDGYLRFYQKIKNVV